MYYMTATLTNWLLSSSKDVKQDLSQEGLKESLDGAIFHFMYITLGRCEDFKLLEAPLNVYPKATSSTSNVADFLCRWGHHLCL